MHFSDAVARMSRKGKPSEKEGKWDVEGNGERLTVSKASFWAFETL